jgi:hypothetical protein
MTTWIGPLLLSVASAASVALAQDREYRPAPDFSNSSPFIRQNAATIASIKAILRELEREEQPCPSAEALPSNDAAFLICTPRESKSIRDALVSMAPALSATELRLWATDPGPDRERELIVGATFTDSNGDPWLSLWILHWQAQRYEDGYLGQYLAGSLYSLRAFGPQADGLAVFVKHLSCTECCATVYLTITDISNRGWAYPYRFTYAQSHDVYGTVIEYELPGRGHTVDAQVETRIPSHPGVAGPHLIQHFALLEGGHEWWVFRCIELKCDYELFDQLPITLHSVWQEASRL